MMQLGQDLRRRATLCAAAALSLLLAACFVLPGKFDSSLDLRRDGRFACPFLSTAPISFGSYHTWD